MYIDNFTVGSDPELFIINEKTGKVVSSIGLIPGVKGEPWVGSDMPSGFGLETDNILAEFNIPPVTDCDNFVNNIQYMKDYDTSFRILEEPLMVVGIGVAFAKDDDRGICEQMDQTLEEMRQDGTSLKIVEKYLDDPRKYLEVDDLGY